MELLLHSMAGERRLTCIVLACTRRRWPCLQVETSKVSLCSMYNTQQSYARVTVCWLSCWTSSRNSAVRSRQLVPNGGMAVKVQIRWHGTEPGAQESPLNNMANNLEGSAGVQFTGLRMDLPQKRKADDSPGSDESEDEE